jgi:hypothetical protein
MRFLRGALFALCIGFVGGGAATADTQGAEDTPRGKPTNLQALSKDIPATTLGRLMKRYERDLGVSCSYCHVENRDTGKLDYVSDENPKKHIARIMITMVADINERHLEQLGGDRRYEVAVTCGSCHQGRANPQPYEGTRP